MTGSGASQYVCGCVLLCTFITIATFLRSVSNPVNSEATARGFKTLVDFSPERISATSANVDYFSLSVQVSTPTSSTPVLIVDATNPAITSTRITHNLENNRTNEIVTTFDSEVCLPTQVKSEVRCDGGCGDYRSQYVKFGPPGSQTSSDNPNDGSNGRVDVDSAEACCEICFYSDCSMYVFNVGKRECYLLSRDTGVSLRTGAHTIGKVQRHASWSPELHYTTEIAKVPPTYGGKRHDERCTQDGCDFLYPMVAPPTPGKPADLPTMPSTRMKFLSRTGEVQFTPISSAPATSLDECRASCITLEDCIAWTHDSKAKTCTLFPAAEISFTRTTEQHCTTGVVRAGIRRLQQRQESDRGNAAADAYGNVPREQHSASDTTDLTNVDVPVLGQCIRGASVRYTLPVQKLKHLDTDCLFHHMLLHIDPFAHRFDFDIVFYALFTCYRYISDRVC